MGIAPSPFPEDFSIPICWNLIRSDYALHGLLGPVHDGDEGLSTTSDD
jgi:hypothetical protein